MRKDCWTFEIRCEQGYEYRHYKEINSNRASEATSIKLVISSKRETFRV